jgi:hypothetical protein
MLELPGPIDKHGSDLTDPVRFVRICARFGAFWLHDWDCKALCFAARGGWVRTPVVRDLELILMASLLPLTWDVSGSEIL